MTTYTLARPGIGGTTFVEITHHATSKHLAVGDTVRIAGDTFCNPYTVVALITRVSRSLHRLFGGDSSPRAVIRTWAGTDRIVDVDRLYHAGHPWNISDTVVAGNRVHYRAELRKTMARKAAERKEAEIRQRSKDLRSIVLFLRGSLKSRPDFLVELDIARIARARSIPESMLRAMVYDN